MWITNAARPRLAASWTAVALLATGAAQADPLDPGARLCLHPPQLPVTDSQDDPRTRRLESKLVEQLEAAGFELVGPAAVEAVVDRVARETPAAVDPYTGRRDAARHSARRVALAEALRSELACDARLLARVVPVWAFFNAGIASWDGRTENVSSAGRVVLQVLGGVAESGFVRALSLWLRVLDPEGEQIAFRSAGIETLVAFGVITDKDLLPEDQWLLDDTKLDDAIASALGSRATALRLEGDPHRTQPEK